MADKINCLVQLRDGNKNDFTEWLEYHLALGFDQIFVFSSNEVGWLEGLCERYRHVTLVPNNADWSRKSSIISTYVSRRSRPEWLVCVDEHDFIYLDPKQYPSIRDFIGAFNNVSAITLFTKYMSSERGMKYRVGTQLDCFTHTRPEPEGNQQANALTPATGITFVRIDGTRMPMRSPIVPMTRAWCDASGAALTDERLNAVLTSRSFAPTRFAARCYRFGLRSGSELKFQAGSNPTGFYTVLDRSLQDARARLNYIPVNLETEKLFAKTEEPVVEQVEFKADVSRLEELDFDSNVERRILEGKFLEEIIADLRNGNAPFDEADITERFDRIRARIAADSPIYESMQRMLDAGLLHDEIRHHLHVTPMAYERMQKCLAVLDIVPVVRETPVQCDEPNDESDAQALPPEQSYYEEISDTSGTDGDADVSYAATVAEEAYTSFIESVPQETTTDADFSALAEALNELDTPAAIPVETPAIAKETVVKPARKRTRKSKPAPVTYDDIITLEEEKQLEKPKPAKKPKKKRSAPKRHVEGFIPDTAATAE